MLNLSYSLSPIVRDRLKEIDELRKEILLTPISPKEEMRLRWDALINRIHYSLSLAGNKVERKNISKILTAQINLDRGETLNKLDREERDVIGYKKALDTISREWMVSKKHVSVKDILILYDMFCDGRMIIPASRLSELLDYIQAHKENPVILAGISYIGIESIKPFSDGNSRLARILAYLFLFKNGFDIRGLIQFGKNWTNEPTAFQDALRIGLNASSITLWLEFFCNEIASSLKEEFDKIRSEKIDNIGLDASFWGLNDRQKVILNLLEEPNSIISNKKVQKHFKISQITASRDLTKLSTLGYITQRGKGRSVYYTKL